MVKKSEAKNGKNWTPYLLSIVSQKGGVGKTTVAVNIASQLGLLGYKTLIVDEDTINPSILYYFKIDKIAHDFVDVMKKRTDLRDAVIFGKIKNLDVLPGLSGLAPVVPSEKEVIATRKIFSDKLRGRYDFIIIDTPPGYFPREAYNTCNDIFIVFTPSISSCVAAARLYKECKGKNLRCGLVGNMITTGKEANVREMMDTYGDNVLNLIPKMRNAERALQVHVPLCIFDKKTKFALATKGLAKKIVARSTIKYKN